MILWLIEQPRVIRPHGVNHAVNCSVKLFNDNGNLHMGRVHPAGINMETHGYRQCNSCDCGDLPGPYWKICKTVNYCRQQRGFSTSTPPDPEVEEKQMLVNLAIAGSWANKTHRARISPLPQKADTFRRMVWSELSAPLIPRKLGTGTGTGNGR